MGLQKLNLRYIRSGTPNVQPIEGPFSESLYVGNTEPFEICRSSGEPLTALCLV